MATVLITGGTGLIGARLTEMLTAKGYHVIILTRSKDEKNKQNISYAEWDIKKGWIDENAVAQADYIIHLAGANVADKRWTKNRKKEIVESRTKSAALLVQSLHAKINKVEAVVSASAIGWYGADTNLCKQNGFKETDAPANDFLGTTCQAWEKSIQPVEDLKKRLVIIRTGVVLSNEGGAFAEFKKPLKAGIAAILGNGQQTISWIHIDDICRLYIYALENKQLSGVYNAIASMPVSNEELIMQLAKHSRGKFYISVHVPSFLLKLALGEMSIEVLKSATVSNTKIKEKEFIFLYPSIESALKKLVTDDKHG